MITADQRCVEGIIRSLAKVFFGETSQRNEDVTSTLLVLPLPFYLKRDLHTWPSFEDCEE